MKYGYYTRTAPRVNVLRGYPGNESTGLTVSAPIMSGVTVYSGQLITLYSATGAVGSYQWALAGTTTYGVAAGQSVYIAMADSTDTDVISSGRLLGLSCSGNFEVQTGYFISGDTFTKDIPVTWSTATAGSLTATTYTAATQTDIIGYVSGGKIDLATGGPGVGYKTAGLPANVANAGIDSQAALSSGHTYVIQWVTRFLPKREISAAQA